MLTEVIFLLMGAFVGWVTAHSYYRKSTRDLRAEASELKEQIVSLKQTLRPKTTLEDFASALDGAGDWVQDSIANETVWIYQPDNSFQIVVGDLELDEPFSEPWIVFPDQHHNYRLPVRLSISGNTIKELDFISADGGRVFVPLPNSKRKGDTQISSWEESAISFKVGVIIGRFYIYKDMEGIARVCDIKIYRGRRDERLGHSSLVSKECI
jgi:hypothetical protein